MRVDEITEGQMVITQARLEEWVIALENVILKVHKGRNGETG
jgi:hypothetical protein